MKKYRCPSCGEECITLKNKIFSYGFRNPNASYADFHGNRCPNCNCIFLPRIKYDNKWCSRIVLCIILALFIIEMYLVIFVSTNYAFICLGLLIVIPLIIAPLLSINRALTIYDRNRREHIIPETNARVIIEKNSKRIDNLDIYGIKFERLTKAIRFHETFTNDLVPVVFHKKDKKQGGETEVTIMKKKFIPGELLFYGSKFTVIDNGKEIASGFIQTVYE